MEGLEGLTSLTRLTLYDNQILSLNVPPSLSGLTYLDMSYNLIKSTAALAVCPLLEEVSIPRISLTRRMGPWTSRKALWRPLCEISMLRK